MAAKKKEPLTGRGGPNRGQGRHQKLEEPVRLSVNVERELLRRLDEFCETHRLANKTGGSRTAPRGDIITAALEVFLDDPGRILARCIKQRAAKRRKREAK